MLLAQEAVQERETLEAEGALRKALAASTVRATFGGPVAPSRPVR